MEDKEKPEQEEKIVFTDRRVTAFIGRTLKTDAVKFEFIKFGLGFEGTIGDGVDRSAAHDQIFKDMMTEVILREAAIKTAHDVDNIDHIVRLLKNIQKDAEQKQPEVDEDPHLCPSFGTTACPSSGHQDAMDPDGRCKSCGVMEDIPNGTNISEQDAERAGKPY